MSLPDSATIEEAIVSSDILFVEMFCSGGFFDAGEKRKMVEKKSVAWRSGSAPRWRLPGPSDGR